MTEAAPARRIRRAARIILFDNSGRVLLFRFVTGSHPPFWCAPGGECDPDEDFAAAARRELREETGIDAQPRPLGITKRYDFVTIPGELVTAHEVYFCHRAGEGRIDTAGHTALEREVMIEHRWFERDDLAQWPERVWPQDLAALLDLARADETTGTVA